MDRDDPWDENDGEELEAEIMRAYRPSGADLRGTTADEELAGIGLDEALTRERPEGRATDEVVAIEDDGTPDVEIELVADGTLESDRFASPEEAALSIRDRAPGATDHPDAHARFPQERRRASMQVWSAR
jgi:hypothetical protein